MPRQTWSLPGLVLTMIILIVSSTASAQSSNQNRLDNVALPKLLPASPEPTAFMRAAFANTNMSTGAASAQVPLYTIKVRDFSFPISLSYSTQGLKADEPTTRTGLGWVLNAIGMVTRSVKGVPDEFGMTDVSGHRMRLPASSGFPGVWDAYDPTLFGHYHQATDQGASLDTEVDEFNFHVNGQKGSFVLDDSWHPKSTNATNAKITMDFSPTAPISGVTIVMEDGVAYHFGSDVALAYEQTFATNMAQFDPNKANTRTALFLDKITLVTGEQINFVYGPEISYTLATGINQSLTVVPPAGMGYAQNSFLDQQNNVSYRTRAIQSIQVSNGTNVNFTYSGSGLSMRLAGIDVVDTQTSVTPIHLKTYRFEYYDVPAALHPRFFLTKIVDTTGPTLYHEFAYNDLEHVPGPLTYGQDFGGFYNGSGSTTLIPNTVASDGTIDLSFRKPNPDAAMKGTLTSITYPTGGKQEFFYEANTRTDYNYRSGGTDTLTIITPGVRVREVRSADQFTGTTTSKYYTYATLGDLKHSTGTGGDIPSALSSQHMRVYTLNGVQVADFEKSIYSSNTMNQVFSLAGSPVYYNTVIESDDPDFANGGTEYTFYGFDGGSSTALLLGQAVPFVGGGQYPTLSGEVHYKKMFDKNKTIVQVEETNWETISDDSPAAGFPLSYHIRRNFDAQGVDYNRLNSFDVMQVEYGKVWNRITYKLVTTYAGGVAYSQRTDYTYSTDWANLLPKRVTFKDSRNLEYRTEMEYANTTISDLGYTQLVAANRLNIPVYKAQYYRDSLQQEQRIFYSNTVPSVEVKIQFKSTAKDSLHDEIVFNSYDGYSHPRSVQKVNDVEFTYLWDLRLHQPIAEVRNASPNDVAFSSFENGATGNWSLTGAIETTRAYTGSHSFKGYLLIPIDTIPYTVSLWAYNSLAPTVNGVTGKLLRSNNGWNLLYWRVKLTSPGALTVHTQNQYADEVRLHPEGAEMVTYTYLPFIGVGSKIDANQRAAFYEYDSSHRLTLIRDQDNNVVKTFDYHYEQQN